jgi:multidrug efflux pump subunit AcrA (membrane-fusion protein)
MSKALHHYYKSYGNIYLHNYKSKVRYWFWGIIIFLCIVLCLPWTQNVRSTGYVTSFNPLNRPQQLNSPIPGRIVKWYVKEGDKVQVGDTLLQIGEIKEDYLDPNLVARTREQREAKERGINFYEGKVKTADQQVQALEGVLKAKINELQNKIRQTNVKIKTNNIETTAAQNDYDNAKKQYDRLKTLYDEGANSLTELERRNVAMQNAQAKYTKAQNDGINLNQDLSILENQLIGAQQEYYEKVSKTTGEKFQSLTQIATAESEVAKLRNMEASYTIRNGFYYILAPQAGQITQAQKAGLNEVIKEGERLVEIVPEKRDLAVEIFVKPLDVPLLAPGQKMRLVFDGFPAIVFSGWPNSSFGTFGGIITVVESNATNGKFRVLITPDPNDKPWPPQLLQGTGTNGIALLKNVRIYYELWRQINGFPPDYYKPNMKKDEAKK